MKYFEFDKHEYYALIAAEDTDKAVGIYVENVAGDSVEQIKEEGIPSEITREQALEIFTNTLNAICPTEKKKKWEEEFNEYKDDPILIDSSLM
ncbi:hypothetical protein [Bacillus thuringiensis]|uniref:Uncharacterized protein n=1 Tax=Bacillus thuringiensis subsp. higo TaxID=132266 RepID=A0A9X6QJT7_BACUH|nr:hypothetical protein [Bacillus thuringiensis]OUB41429.1 hypothetical protein BK716_29505 [Bacillus thuringiensis serovar higo]OUB61235.1 hypothetical protein BK716_01645 [Bacillus thuringiensis serovar higo]